MHKSTLLIIAILMVSQAAVIPSVPSFIAPGVITSPPIVAPIVTDQVNEVIRNSAGLNDAVNNVADGFFNDFIFKPTLRSVDGDVYYGSAEITITNGDQKKIDFFGTFIPQAECSYSRCFFGWIDNYTIAGEATILGVNGNDTIKPYFEFKTNSQEDFIINRDPKLKQQWVQIIEVLCQKINPQITQANPADEKAQASAKDQKFVAKSLTSGQDLSSAQPTSDALQKPEESLLPTYSFATIQSSDLDSAKKLRTSTLTINRNVFTLDGLVAGDQVSKLTKNVQLEGLKAPASVLTETLVLNSDNLVKKRSLDYQLKLDSSAGLTSDNGQAVPSFEGLIKLNFGFGGKTKVAQSSLDAAKSALSNKSQFDLKLINERRAKLGTLLEPTIILLVDQGPKFSDAEVLTFNNQKLSGINPIQKINQLDTAAPATAKLAISSLDVATLSTGRNLQLLQNYTIYNYKKVIFSKSIFGKTFSADVEVKCYILVYPSDHEIQCIGTFNYQLFGNSKSVTIFNFKKSIKYAWNWSNTYSGNWGFSVWIGLPSPVNFIGITFNFNVKYTINVNISIGTTAGASTYVVKAACVATTKVDTDASAAIRVIAIEGGVFISGTLLNAGTDPRIQLTYYYTKKMVNVLAQWYFWINAFNYKWGFFYRTWSFWSGWSGRKIISQWNINAVYGKWVIVNKSWDIYF